MFTPRQPHAQSLGNGLTLKSVATHDDIERLSAFNAAVHDAHVGDMTRTLIRHHPHTQPEHWLFIEEEASGQIVSALCLIPWTWQVEDVALKVDEMGIVGTLPGYRQRGLVRALDWRFKALLGEGGFHLSPLQGIPYFYRQFGYEYAIPLEGGWHLRFDQVADLPAEAGRYTFRPAVLSDLPALTRFYDEAARDLPIHAVRDAAVWRYLLENRPDTATASETWLALDGDGQPAGYWRIEQFGFGEGLNVSEASRLPHAAALAVLGRVKALAVERRKPFIRLACADTCPLVPAARAWGAQDAGRYAWQIHIPDPAHLLRALAPVLERRIASSPFAGLSEVIHLNLYREAFDLHFVDGRLTAISAVGFSERGEIRIPPPLLAPLLLGYRSHEELRAAHPDVWVTGQARYLVDVLFPRRESFIYTIY